VEAVMPRLTPSPLGAHGGRAAVRIDLSASLNPLGPSPMAVAAAAAADLTRYPDPGASDLVQAAALRHGLPDEAVVPVPGASWGLWLCLVAHGEPNQSCVAVGPCFGEYRRHAEIAGAAFSEVRSGLDEALALEPDICILGNPANPSGQVIRATELDAACAANPRTLFIVDEAFAPFAPESISLIERRLPPANAIVVRSQTKELGLPGLRMGYLVATPERAVALRAMLPAWPMSAPALAAAAAGCSDLEHIRGGAETARRHVRLLAEAVTDTGGETRPTSANYVLCRRDGLAVALAAHGIAARDCASFGLAGWLRLAAPSPADLPLVLEAIRG
jgi:adenosylcobyric acid synthase